MALSVAGCASIQGQPDPLITRADALAPLKGKYQRQAVLENFASDSDAVRGGLTRRAYRDMVAYVYLGASDANYQDFRAHLSKEMKGSNFGLNLGVLVMNGIAAVSGVEAANALAAGSATLVGTNAALGKDVFQERTIDAVISTMDAARTRHWTEVRRSLIEQDEAQFPLGEVLQQIDQLEGKASLYEASGQIAATAGAEKKAADDDAQLVGAYSVPLLPTGVAGARTAFANYVRGLDDAAKLEALRVALGAEADADMRHLKNKIIRAYGQQALTQAAVEALSDKLKATTGRDFK